MSKHYPSHLKVKLSALLIGLIALAVSVSLSIEKRQRPAATASHSIKDVLDNLPLVFEENRGQTDESFRFIARGDGFIIYFSQNEALIDLSGSKLALRLADSRSDLQVEGLDPIAGKSNYFIGNQPAQWQTDVPNYSRLRFSEVYPGIDLHYYGNRGKLEYDFVLAPRADPQQIRMVMEGAEHLRIDERGDLLIAIESTQLRMRSPDIYQDIDGERRRVEGGFRICGQDQVSFQIGGYDPNHTLVIDPVVDYSTYLGGSGADIGYGIAVDQRGNVYVTGQTSSLNFPTKNPYDSSLDGASDAFVAKINPTNATLVYATYIGGRNPGDRSWAIAVDRAGNVYFTGETTSLNFPVVNAAQPTFRGNGDAFIAKLNVEGNVLLYSTYHGGSFFDAAYSLTLDRFDNAYLTGRTNSANFPVRNALQPQIRGQRDAFVTKVDPDGAIVFSTFLGGDPQGPGERDEETGFGIALDPLVNIYVTGVTTAPDFPLVNASQPIFGGVEDAFVTKLDSSGSSIIYSTYLGGNRVDDARAITVDSFGNAYITGYTLSSDFPQINPLQSGYAGGIDGFIAKLNASGNSLIYSTYLGGSGAENNGLISDNIPGCALAVDNLGFIYVTGKTESTNFPLTNPIQPALRGTSDAYISKVDPTGTSFVFSTFLGSTFTGNTGYEEQGLAIALDNSGRTYLTGQVLANDFPTAFPFQREYGGGLSDAFITRISTPDIATIAPVSAASFQGAAHAADAIVSLFGTNLASGIAATTGIPLPTSLLDTTVRVVDETGVERPAQLFFVSPSQVNFLMPPETRTGKATIRLTNGSALNVRTTVWINNVAPGLFSADGSGQGLPSASLLRVKADGAQSFEPVVTLNDQGQIIPVLVDLGPEGDRVFLILFGTGLRNRSSVANVLAQIGGIAVPVLYAGPQGGFIGEDQVNLQLPRSLAGRGTVRLTLTADGMIANPLNVTIR